MRRRLVGTKVGCSAASFCRDFSPRATVGGDGEEDDVFGAASAGGEPLDDLRAVDEAIIPCCRIDAQHCERCRPHTPPSSSAVSARFLRRTSSRLHGRRSRSSPSRHHRATERCLQRSHPGCPCCVAHGFISSGGRSRRVPGRDAPGAERACVRAAQRALAIQTAPRPTLDQA